MNSQLQGNRSDSDEIDLFEIWAKIKPVAGLHLSPEFPACKILRMNGTGAGA